YRYLTGPGNRARAALGQDVGHLDLVVLRHRTLDVVDTDQLVLQGQQVLERLADQLDGDIATPEMGTGDDPLQGSLQLTDVGTDPLGDEECGVVGQIDTRLLGLLHENGHPSLPRRWLDRDGQPPAET